MVFTEEWLANYKRRKGMKPKVAVPEVAVPAPAKRHKFGAEKMEVDGITFVSRKEAAHYSELLLLLKAKKIENLALQVPFLITINNIKICKYLADFTYTDDKGVFHVEDVKGMRTPIYKLKKRMVEATYPFKIEEV